MIVKFRGYNNEVIFSEVETFTCEDVDELVPGEFDDYNKRITLYFRDKGNQPYSMIMSEGSYNLAIETYEKTHYFVFTSGKHISFDKIGDCANLLKR